jgi:hypothetical protein
VDEPDWEAINNPQTSCVAPSVADGGDDEAEGYSDGVRVRVRVCAGVCMCDSA